MAKIYISILTNKKTGTREVGQVTYTKKSAWIYKNKIESSKEYYLSHTEEWEDNEDNNLYTKKKEYILEEDWGMTK